MIEDKDQVRAIADILWQFHNDRLKDPSINEMKPYIEPLQKLIQARVEKAIYKPARMVELMADGYSFDEAEAAINQSEEE